MAKPKMEMRHLMQKFDPKEGDISLYLVLFERQARWVEINEDSWVSHLIGLLPYEMSQLIARESEEVSNDYSHIKKNYFEEWLNGLEVKTFAELSDLIVTEQIKRRVPWEVKEHFIDEWADVKSLEVLAKRLDEYDSVRSLWKKKSYSGYSKERFPTWKAKSPIESKTLPVKREEHGVKKSTTNTEDFEKRRTVRCYKCGSKEHIRPNRPLLRNKESSATVNHLFEAYEDDVMSPHTSMGEVNGFPMPILRDTGSSIDVVCLKVVKPEMFTGEHVWVQQPLDDAPMCLPLAEVERKGEFGHLITKAAIMCNKADKGRYLLGNRTVAIVEKMKKIPVPQQVNAIQTRAQKRLEKQEEVVYVKDKDPISVEETEMAATEDIEIENDDLFSFPPKEEFEGLSWLKIDSKAFIEAQQGCKELQSLTKKILEKTDSRNEFEILPNGLLVKRKTNKVGEDKLLLVVPKQFRERLKALCHEGASSHLRVTKAKDILAKYFFWSNCFQEIEEYVRSCDHCQRVGKPNDKKRAPMKLVPIIQEVFAKINVDAVGPLPITASEKIFDYSDVLGV
ncbi:hypothetical protein AVEN_86473-1 [Araneus ventricosus]|uniref:Integrase zinc-binding domain-containing protein n=1 Tax=Araneus ventricosus TaxID=182803 RepID=A0A4Y2AX41_ARAVE|nr:hypothetical protein AVEN_560-1 [Araneus ventricosus]GBL84283.1 hypothetical protein AVEN_16713-1 [Araneus ventricosus]GBL84303.1 hypothetical protein AVEN_76741-1 [Araneus ventricosus]GBL84312.1 hypothetical protein AVEN_86473-1 [Araneus ventricosus]